MKKVIKRIALSLIILSLSFFVLFQMLILPIRIVGNSMHPTLQNHQTGFSIKNNPFTELNRFDVVIIQLPQTNELIVKRIVGLPNETVSIENDTLYINHRPVAEPFLENDYVNAIRAKQNDPFTFRVLEIKLGDDQYYVLGDNRPLSQDSRFFGPISRKDIIAKGFIDF